jgi:putative ABC transport system substrate-binding protein
LTCLTRGTLAAKKVAGSIPIVFTWVADPVGAKLVQSYGRPGGNVTGVTNRFGELLVKRLELAHELLPGARRIAVLGVVNALYPLLSPRLRRAAGQLGVELAEFNVIDWGSSIERAKLDGAAAAIPFTQFAALGMRVSGESVVAAELEHHVPVIFAGSEMVEAGGLISYGTNIVDDVRRAADLLARVLEGASPATVPVDQAARFELAVNRKTAKAMGIAIPQSILLRADRVIE